MNYNVLILELDELGSDGSGADILAALKKEFKTQGDLLQYLRSGGDVVLRYITSIGLGDSDAFSVNCYYLYIFNTETNKLVHTVKDLRLVFKGGTGSESLQTRSTVWIGAEAEDEGSGKN